MKTQSITLLAVNLLFSFFTVFGHGNHGHSNATDTENGVRFSENIGQWDAPVIFRLKFKTGTLFLERDRLTFSFYDGHDLEKMQDTLRYLDNTVKAHAWQMIFANANPYARLVGESQYPHYENYYIGNDPSKWKSDIKVFAAVRYRNIYPGIDFLIEGIDNQLKYSFIVKPGADPKNIEMIYEGLNSIYLSNNQLHYTTSVNTVYEESPYTYQIANKRIEIPTEFELNENRVKFKLLRKYDLDYPLIIDPTLVFSTYTGSFADNFGFTATYDNAGNYYAGGIAFGFGYPVTTGAFQTTFAGGSTLGVDVSITKFNPTGTGLIYSTYLGGSSDESPSSLVVNSNNELIIMGVTGSLNFPTTPGAYDQTFNGGVNVSFPQNGTYFPNGTDIFVAKLNAAGSALLGSTYIGGLENDGVNYNSNTQLQYNYGDQFRGEVIVDNNGFIYVASTTRSFNFPVTGGVFQPNLTGTQAGCVFRLSPTFTTLMWSSYLGGTGLDAAYSLKLHASGDLFVCGGTTSTNFPNTAGALNATYQGGAADGFISRINSTATTLIRSTYLGTSAYDQSYFVEIDGNGNIYTVGQTRGNYPIVNAPYFNAGGSQYIHKLNADLTNTIFSTRFGSGTVAVNISPTAFLVDLCENVYVSGWGGGTNNGWNTQTGSTFNLPITPNAYQTGTDGSDFYFIVFERNMNSLLYGSYFGGNGTQEHVDGGTSRFDKNGVIYQAVCAGCGGNSLFPTTPGVWSRFNQSNNCNLGAIKFELPLGAIEVEVAASPAATGCAPFIVQFNDNGFNASQWQWSFGDGNTSTLQSPVHTYQNPGVYEVRLIGIDNTTCVGITLRDTSFTTIVVRSSQFTEIDAEICDGDGYFFAGNFQTITGTYYDTLLTPDGCDSIIQLNLNVLSNSFTAITVSICQGESYFAGGANQTIPGIYLDILTAANGCDSIIETTLNVSPEIIFTQDISICSGQSFFAGGAQQTASGSYVDSLLTSSGCDSIIITNLTLLPAPVAEQDVSICDGENYFAGGGLQTTAGTYFDTLTAANGCDSIVQTNLFILSLAFETVNVSICDGESYFAGGALQTSAGEYFDTLTAVNGCDSIVTTNLMILLHSFTELDVSICDGDGHFAGGNFQTTAGTYFDTLIAANGCDSIVTTNLIILPLSFTTLDIEICDGESHFAGGALQTTAGQYFDTLTAVNGCDSIVTTNLMILLHSFTELDVSICDGDGHFAEVNFQTTAGTYFDTLVAANGCDSVVQTNLTILPLSFTTLDIEICDGENHFAGGGLQNTTGQYFDTLTAANGCDSIVTTNLTILPLAYQTRQITICTGNSFFAGGAVQTQSGTYLDTFTASNGCDSILTTELFVLPAPVFTQSFEVCAGEGVFAGGAFQTVSGVYYDTIVTDEGCDSIIATMLRVADPLQIYDFDVQHIGCGCVVTTGDEICVLNFAGLPHGAIIPEYFPDLGVTVLKQAYAGWPQALIVFNSNLTTPTPDPELQAGIGNLAIFPRNLTDNNGDGLVDVPDDQSAGGVITFIFDEVRTFFGLTLVDNDRNNGTIRAFDENNNLITSVPTPSGVKGSVQVYDLNIPNVKKVTLTYADSRGVTDIKFSCPPPKFGVDLEVFEHGEILTNREIAPGVTVSAISNTNKPNEVIIFNSNVTGTNDPDLEVSIGNLLIIPENITDNTGDGLVDSPDDSNVGGFMTFTFDTDRTVFSITLVDNDRNNGWIKAYDENDNQIKHVSTPSGAEGSIQVIQINTSNVRKLVLYYWDSRGVTALMLDCPPVECCDGSAIALVSGGTPPYSYEWSTGSTEALAGDSLCRGVYDVTVTDLLGCITADSVIIGQEEAVYTFETVALCSGDSVFAGGAFQTAAGTYHDTLGFENGCFEVLVTELIAQPSYFISEEVIMDEGDSIFLAGAYQTEAGVYSDVFQTIYGCDSIIEITLIITPARLIGNKLQEETSVHHFVNLQVYPVPFVNHLIAQFNSPEDGSVRVRMLDLAGRLLIEREFAVAKGINQLIIQTNEHLPDGAYLLELRNNTGYRMSRMVLK